MVDEPKYRRPLNSEQIKVLQLLYRFRFATSDLVAEYFGKQGGVFVYNRLSVLHKQGLIGKRFDKRYRLAGRPAAYYLLPAGARKLEELDTDAPYDRNLYKEMTVSDRFVDKCLDILRVYNYFKEQHGDQLTFSTKVDMSGFDYFPPQLPDAFIRLTTNDVTHCYFLDVYDGTTQPVDIRKKVKGYLDFKGSGGWAVTGATFPLILCVCDSLVLQNRLISRIKTELKKSWHDDVMFLVAIKVSLRKDGGQIWHSVSDSDELLSLELIS